MQKLPKISPSEALACRVQRALDRDILCSLVILTLSPRLNQSGKITGVYMTIPKMFDVWPPGDERYSRPVLGYAWTGNIIISLRKIKSTYSMASLNTNYHNLKDWGRVLWAYTLRVYQEKRQASRKLYMPPSIWQKVHPKNYFQTIGLVCDTPAAGKKTTGRFLIVPGIGLHRIREEYCYVDNVCGEYFGKVIDRLGLSIVPDERGVPF